MIIMEGRFSANGNVKRKCPIGTGRKEYDGGYFLPYSNGSRNGLSRPQKAVLLGQDSRGS